MNTLSNDLNFSLSALSAPDHALRVSTINASRYPEMVLAELDSNIDSNVSDFSPACLVVSDYAKAAIKSFDEYFYLWLDGPEVETSN